MLLCDLLWWECPCLDHCIFEYETKIFIFQKRPSILISFVILSIHYRFLKKGMDVQICRCFQRQQSWVQKSTYKNRDFFCYILFFFFVLNSRGLFCYLTTQKWSRSRTKFKTEEIIKFRVLLKNVNWIFEYITNGSFSCPLQDNCTGTTTHLTEMTCTE